MHDAEVDGLTENTAPVANTRAYTRIPGLDDGPPIFAIVATSQARPVLPGAECCKRRLRA